MQSSIREGIYDKLEPIPATVSEIRLLTGFRDVVCVPSMISQRRLVDIPVPCNIIIRIRLALGFGVTQASRNVRKGSGGLG